MLESETKLYLQQIGQYPLLSPEQEEELVKNKRPGWRNTLINSNLRLVVSIAKVYARNTKVALLDLIQAGNIGLCLAADRFELGHGAKFSTYATWWIKQSINKEGIYFNRSIRLPLNKMHSIAEYKAAFSCLFDELGRHPSVEEIASYMGYSIAKMNELISYSFLEDRYGNGMTSLDTDVGEDGNETTLGSLVIDERVGDLFDSFFEKETETVVQKQLDKLFPERVKEVITLRYGLGGKEKHTLEYVGERLGITRERVRQIQAKAVKEMKNSPELRALIN